MRSLAQLRSASAATVRANTPPPDAREFAEVAGGGGATATAVMAEIVAITGTTFSCKLHDESGNPTGDAFTVYVVSSPTVGGLIGQQPLAVCDPKRVVGDLIPIVQRNQYIGNGEYLSGWWAVQEFTSFGGDCECTEL